MTNNQENLAFCSQQIKVRLRNTSFFNKLDPLNLKDLWTALLNAADSQAQAEMVIDIWLMDNSGPPRVADIYRIVAKLKGPVAAVAVPAPCVKCVALGGRVVSEIPVKVPVFAGETQSVVTECDCALGEFLRAGYRRIKEEDSRSAPLLSGGGGLRRIELDLAS